MTPADTSILTPHLDGAGVVQCSGNWVCVDALIRLPSQKQKSKLKGMSQGPAEERGYFFLMYFGGLGRGHLILAICLSSQGERSLVW